MSHIKRANRVGGLIQRELSGLLLTKIKDPRLELVTITGVKITDDLRSARIYVSAVQGKARSEAIIAGFESAVGFLRHELGRRLDLRYTPSLTFIYDESFDRADELNRMMKAFKDEAGLADSDTAEDEKGV